MHMTLEKIAGFTFVFGVLLISACAAPPPKTIDQQMSASGNKRFNNILVVGVAVDYEGRTQFERRLAKDLSKAGTPATAMYVAGGRNKPISRDAIQELVKANGYDSVLISRVIDRNAGSSMKSGSSSTKAVRRDGRPLDLFRYDYEELNEPATVNFSLGVTIYSELFEAEGNAQVWVLETAISEKEHLEQLVNEASEKIVRRLKKDKLIGI